MHLTKSITNFTWYEPFKMHSFFLLFFFQFLVDNNYLMKWFYVYHQ